MNSEIRSPKFAYRVTERFSQYLLLFVFLSISGFSQAEEASLNGTVITIPVVVVGDAFYRIELSLTPGTDPVEFDLIGGEEITGASAIGASTLIGTTLCHRAVPKASGSSLKYI